MRYLFLLTAVLCLLTACREHEKAADEVINDQFKGLNARYECAGWEDTQRCWYILPAQAKAERLLVILHPAFTPVAMVEKIGHMARIATARGYAVLYPEGFDRQWNDFRVMTAVETYERRFDDVGFIDMVTSLAQKEFKLTPKQTAVAGMSNGGMMSLRLACQGERYGKVATVVANLPKGLRNECRARPKPMLMIFGTEDKVVDFGGGALDDSDPDLWGEVESAPDTIAFFARRHGCSAKGTQRILADPKRDATRAIITEHACKTPLTTIVVEKMGHTWPGEPSRMFAWATMRGAVSRQIDASQTILQFIEAK